MSTSTPSIGRRRRCCRTTCRGTRPPRRRCRSSPPGSCPATATGVPVYGVEPPPLAGSVMALAVGGVCGPGRPVERTNAVGVRRRRRETGCRERGRVRADRCHLREGSRPLSDCSIAKPVSLVELSVQETSIRLLDTALAVRLVGAASVSDAVRGRGPKTGATWPYSNAPMSGALPTTAARRSRSAGPPRHRPRCTRAGAS